MTDAETLLRMPARGDAIAALCRRSHVRRLDLFGSAATGHGFDPARSDFDLLVAFDPLPPAEYADAYFALREALGSLLGKPIDLVTEAALANPHLRARIDAERRNIFAAP